MPESHIDAQNDIQSSPAQAGDEAGEIIKAAEGLGEARLAALENEKAELLRLAQTRQAEFENFRRRVERERAETIDFAAAETVRALLPVFDDFERSLSVETADATYAKGVQLIHTRFKEALEKLGLEALESVGKPFDPNLHHGIEMVETDEAEDQTVLGEFQRGYNFRGKLLRPAMVRVAVKK
jgi:molecular chaperone GrpE